MVLKAGAAAMQLVVLDETIEPFVHSTRVRIKSEESMRHKLARKIISAGDSGAPFDITDANFFEQITDAIGARILHLSFAEFAELHPRLLQLFQSAQLDVVENMAYTWDPEYSEAFRALGITPDLNQRYYTSVHYVVGQQTWSAELQVRNLAEEVWGEVDHKFNYPDQHPSYACREQIKVLAHQVMSCSRLVDAIYRTVEESKKPDSQGGGKGSGEKPTELLRAVRAAQRARGSQKAIGRRKKSAKVKSVGRRKKKAR